MHTPFASQFNDSNVQSALNGLAGLVEQAARERVYERETPPPPGPPGSTHTDAAVQAALQSLPPLAQQGIQARQAELEALASGPPGSTHTAPAVQTALQNLAALAQQTAQAAATERERQAPPGAPASPLAAPAVQAALQMQAPDPGLPAVCMLKNSLNGGELAPELSCRYDLPRFQMGCHILQNFIPLPSGGITRRPGFQFVSGTDGGKAARLLPFVYSASLQFMLMILANDGNSTVFMLERDGKTPATESVRMPYKASELNDVSFCQCGKVIYIAHHNHPPAKLVFDGSGFTYEVLDFHIKTQGTEFESAQYYGPWSDDIQCRMKYWKVTCINPVTGEESLPSPAFGMNWPALNSSANGVFIIKPVPGVTEYRVYKLKGGEYGFVGRVTESAEEPEDGWGGGQKPAPPDNPDPPVDPDNPDPPVNPDPPDPPVNPDPPVCTEPEENLALVAKKMNEVEGTTQYTAQSVRTIIEKNFNGSMGEFLWWHPEYNPWLEESAALAMADNPVQTDGKQWVFIDDGLAPDLNDQPPKEFQGFRGPGDYPSIVFLHQQRLGWAATDNDPLTIWMSQTSSFECMTSKMPPLDDDAIEATLASAQANRILWCMPDRSGLAIGTEGEEWYLTGADGAGSITPSSLSFQPQTRYGSEPGVHPTRANASLIFTQRGGRVLRDLGYSYAADRYEAKDLTILANHIFRGEKRRIKDICWQGAPYNILWCATEDGWLAALTYLPENEVAAWHQHLTIGHILSVSSLVDSSGSSRLWLVVNRKDQTFVEIMGDINQNLSFPDIANVGNHFLDGINADEYHSVCVPCLPESGMENGATSMRVKRISAVKARVIKSWPFSFEVHSQNSPHTDPHPVPAKSPSSNDRLSFRNMTDAMRDWACPIGAGFREQAAIHISQSGPAPLTILGLAISMEIARQGAGQI